MENVTVSDIMTKEVITVQEDTPISEAAILLAEHGIDGMPVLDSSGALVGILTEYDLIGKGSAIHLPTFQQILGQLKTSHGSSKDFQKDVKEIANLKSVDVMNPDPLTLMPNASYEETVSAFRDHHRVNPIPVIDEDKKVVGVVSRFDVLKPIRLLGV
ncbi:MAG: CBS domain-containing protein [bacterium]|nr:CBS domain-containing protein [bacterium]